MRLLRYHQTLLGIVIKMTRTLGGGEPSKINCLTIWVKHLGLTHVTICSRGQILWACLAFLLHLFVCFLPYLFFLVWAFYIYVYAYNLVLTLPLSRQPLISCLAILGPNFLMLCTDRLNQSL